MLRAKVQLVYPEFPDTFWSFRESLKYVGKKWVMTPTGAATVASMFPQEDFEVQRIIDLNVEELTDKKIRSADLIGISSMKIQESSRDEIVDRAHFYGVPVLDGGPGPSSYPENSGADFVVQGEAELILPAFLEDFKSGNAKHFYTEENVIREGRFNIPLLRNGKPDLSSTPIPRWDLLNLRDYNSVGIQYSRGCKYNCEFCDVVVLNGRIPRTKSPEQMIREFQAVKNTGFRGSVMVLDDNLMGNTKNLREFLPYLEKWQGENGFLYPLFTQASLDLAFDENKDILEGMVDVGFEEVFIGLESVDEDVLEGMNKRQNTKMSPLESVQRMQKAGLNVSSGFIVGSDEDKPDVFEKLYDFIQTAGIVIPMPGLLIASKGTPLYERLEKEGRLRTQTKGNNTHQLSLNFEPKLDERFLIEGYVDMLKKLFTPKNFYDRDRVLQRNKGQIKRISHLNLEGMVAFGRSLRNHLFAPGVVEYTKYLLETLATNPRYFPDAVSTSIKLDHYKVITSALSEAHCFTKQTETLYEQFSTYLQDLSQRCDVREKVRQVRKRANSILRCAEEKCHKLHKDFREEATEQYETLRDKINRELERYNLPVLESVSVE